MYTHLTSNVKVKLDKIKAKIRLAINDTNYDKIFG